MGEEAMNRYTDYDDYCYWIIEIDRNYIVRVKK